MKILNSIDTESLMISSIKIPHSQKKNLETKIRCLFLSKGYRKFPKKEYIRCKLIRGHKRMLREIQANESNIDIFFENDLKTAGKANYLPKMVAGFTANRDSFEKIIQVEAGPVNVTMKKKEFNTENLKKSFNAEFCREYFGSAVMRESYYYYIEYLFSDLSCLELNKRFGFRCCSSLTHKTVCLNKWILMKRYCKELVLEDIGIQPFELRDENAKIPTFYVNQNSSKEVCLFS